MQTLSPAEYIECNIGLINKIANKFSIASTRFSREDLIQEGKMAAIIALQAFDHSRGTSKISTYIYRAVYRAMRDVVKKNIGDLNYKIGQQNADYHAEQSGEEVNYPVGYQAISLSTECGEDLQLYSVVPSGAPPVIDKLIENEQVTILLEEIDSLPERDKKIIRLRYLESLKLREISAELGITEQRICQISNRAMDELSRKVKSRLKNELL